MTNLFEKLNHFLSIAATYVSIKIRGLTLEFSDGDLLEDVVFKKNKGYYITLMSCYVDLIVDVTKLPQFDKIKEVSD